MSAFGGKADMAVNESGHWRGRPKLGSWTALRADSESFYLQWF